MALKELAKATKCIYEVLKQRLAAVGPGEDMKVKLMSQCFCLRRLALSDATFDMSVAEGASFTAAGMARAICMGSLSRAPTIISY